MPRSRARGQAAIFALVRELLPRSARESLEAVTTVVLSLMPMFDSEAVTTVVKSTPSIETRRVRWVTDVLYALYTARR